jgi:hypothetical protein
MVYLSVSSVRANLLKMLLAAAATPSHKNLAVLVVLAHWCTVREKHTDQGDMDPMVV